MTAAPATPARTAAAIPALNLRERAPDKGVADGLVASLLVVVDAGADEVAETERIEVEVLQAKY